MPSTHALIVAAGTGTRFSSGELKQYAAIAGRPMLAWSLGAFAGHAGIDAMTVVVRRGDESRVEAIIRDHRIAKVTAIVAGGATRQRSVALGIGALGEECDRVLVHDAARPCVTRDLIARTLTALDEAVAVVPVLPAVDTTVRANADGQISEFLDRTRIMGVQTPQGFDTAVLRRAHNDAAESGRVSSDDGSLVFAIGESVQTIPGERTNIKLTFEDDIPIAEAILSAQAAGRG